MVRHRLPSAAVRVAVDVSPLLGARTGIGTFTDGAIEALLRRGDVSLTGFALSGRSPMSLPAGVAPGRRVPAALMLRLWGSGISWPDARWLSRGAVDVVHGTNFVVPPARGTARVVTVHDLSAIRFPSLCTATTLRYPGLLRRAIREGAWVHTPSAFVADEVCSLLGAAPERVRSVAHGVKPARGDAELGRKIAGFERYVLAVGTVEPRKDLPMLVRAWDDVAEVHTDVALVIAGVDGWGRGALEAALAGAKHGARVVRLGWVSDEVREDLVAGAAVFALPSIYEGFGLPALEAMAAGIPVVATAAGAVPEVVADAALLVPVGDDAGLAAALATVLDDSAEARRLGAAGEQRAAGYSWEACATGLMALYEAATA